MKVYLDNGATTKTDPKVVEVMLPFYTEIYGNPSSLHQFGQDAKKAIEEARRNIAKSINADPEEIIFTSGGTESDNIALKSIARCGLKGKHIITSKIEHPAVLNTCNALEHQGFKVTYIDVDKEGIVKLDDIKKAITDDTILISIMHANNEIGTIQPIEEIAKIAKEKGILFHTDAVQSFLKINFDVKKMDIGLASFSSHKIHGPKGVGFLYKRKNISLCPLLHGGSHEHGFRAGTENVAGIVGMAKAIELYNKKEIEKMQKLKNYFIQELLNIPHTHLNGSKEKRLPNNVNVRFDYIEGESLLMHLDMNNIAVSTGSACSSKSLKPSSVLMSLGLKPEQAHGSIRFTLSKYTTKEELDYTIEKVKQSVKILRKMSPLYKGD